MEWRTRWGYLEELFAARSSGQRRFVTVVDVVNKRQEKYRARYRTNPRSVRQSRGIQRVIMLDRVSC